MTCVEIIILSFTFKFLVSDSETTIVDIVSLTAIVKTVFSMLSILASTCNFAILFVL